MALNWERLARAAMHPVKIAVLEALERGEASPRKLAADFDRPIATVSYHVRQLREAGLIELTRNARSEHGSTCWPHCGSTGTSCPLCCPALGRAALSSGSSMRSTSNSRTNSNAPLITTDQHVARVTPLAHSILPDAS
jgi:hypothetical protein